MTALAALVLSGLLVAGLPGLSAGELSASAAPPDDPDVVHLEAALDRDAARRMEPGVPVTWDIAVSASRDDGVIDVRWEGDDPTGSFSVEVRECEVAWTAGGCRSGERARPIVSADGAAAIATMSSRETRWYRLRIWLADTGGVPDDRVARLTVHARGEGRGDEEGLAQSGGRVGLMFLPALGAVGAGLLLARIARARREAAP